MNKEIFFLLLMGLVLLPATALAIDFSDGGAPFAPQGNAFVVTTIVNNILNNILSFIWVIFIGFAVIMFIWAGILFLSAQGEPEGLKQAKRALLWGIIGVVVGILAFSLPWIIYGGLFGQQNNGGNNNNNPPCVNLPPGSTAGPGVVVCPTGPPPVSCWPADTRCTSSGPGANGQNCCSRVCGGTSDGSFTNGRCIGG